MSEPLWYKDAIFYELHVRSFQDGNNDGIGDFTGLMQRLEYLADLGVTVVWLLPFTCSPLKDDGYDISEYTGVHPNYGTLDDFRAFLEKAHSLAIRVVTELVINHTSDQHPWFQRARRAPVGSSERNFYVWSDSPDRYPGVPLMFPDFENSNWAWDSIAKQYYWHRFYSHQPDLNFDNPDVAAAIMPVVDFWFEMGVDGMRLDAVPYLFEREGTSCEHLPETHAFLKQLRKHVDERFPDRMFVAEANAWPDEMVAYFGNGDECQMAFHFPLMPRLYMALHQENRFPIVDILEQTPAIPSDCQWGLFLRNHDELTLAMVTEQERDAMYSAYARDRQARLFMGIRHRLAPLLRNDRRRIELLNAILFSLPGTPVLYYGDEIGMGDNIYLGDRNGVRTPMQWSDDRNAGFSRANAQKLVLPLIVDSEYHYEAVNVETQQNNPSSLLWWMKRLISLRKRHPTFARGDFEILEPDNNRVLAFVRKTETERLLVVANLCRFVQNVQLDLSEFDGLVPQELFGRSRFPLIKANESYGLTLGPYGFYWFTLVPAKVVRVSSTELPTIPIREWRDLTRGFAADAYTALLMSRYSSSCESEIESCRIIDFKPIPRDGQKLAFFTCRLEFETDPAETIFQWLALVPEERFQGASPLPHAIGLARTGSLSNEVLCDALGLPEVAAEVMKHLDSQTPFSLDQKSQIVCRRWSGNQASEPAEDGEFEVTVPSATEPLSTYQWDRQAVLRRFRRADEGLNPDVEVIQYLQDAGFTGIAPIIGTIEYRRPGNEPAVMAALHQYKPSQSDAWQLMVDQAGRFLEVVAARTVAADSHVDATHVAIDVSSENWQTLIEPFLKTGQSIAAFTAHLHLTLAATSPASALSPAPTQLRPFYQSLRNAAGRLHSTLATLDPAIPASVHGLAKQVRSQYLSILNYLHRALDQDVASGKRIRCHGRYHLGRLLVSGQDFLLTDFEGLKDRPLSERRIKRSPFHDVASMLNSFHYAVDAVRLELLDRTEFKLGFVREEDYGRLATYSTAWLEQLEENFLQVYTGALEPTGLLPPSIDGCRKLLRLYQLEQSFREVENDLTRRPNWAQIPLSAILRIIERNDAALAASDA